MKIQLRLVLFGFVACFAALFLSSRFFPHHLHVVAVFLTTLPLIGRLKEAFNQNRETIVEKKGSPWKANSQLAIEVTLLFVGIFVGALVLQALAPKYFLIPMMERTTQVQKLNSLFFHNFEVLLGCLCLSIFYRSGGLLLVIAWNAIHWSRTLLGVLVVGSTVDGVGKKVIMALSLTPHLLMEALGFILAGVVGVFLSKAVLKYRPGSQMFYRVTSTSLLMIVIATTILYVAAIFEVVFAQGVILRLFS